MIWGWTNRNLTERNPMGQLRWPSKPSLTHIGNLWKTWTNCFEILMIKGVNVIYDRIWIEILSFDIYESLGTILQNLNLLHLLRILFSVNIDWSISILISSSIDSINIRIDISRIEFDGVRSIYRALPSARLRGKGLGTNLAGGKNNFEVRRGKGNI